AGLLLGCGRAHAEKAQVKVVRGHPGVQLPHRGEVLRLRGPDLDRGAVGQQSIDAGPGSCAHIASSSATTSPSWHYPVRHPRRVSALNNVGLLSVIVAGADESQDRG